MMLSRNPTIQELRLLKLLIDKSSAKIRSDWSKNLLVEPMKDGEMGSLLLLSDGLIKGNRSFGTCISEYHFKDKDGIEVVASLNLDDCGELFELDIWKTDFTPLISIPDLT